MSTRTALIGIHDNIVLRLHTRMLTKFGYEVVQATSVDAMLEEMQVNGTPNSSPGNPFDVYIMDVNLGKNNSPDYSPAKRVYGHVQQDVEAGRSKFQSASGNDNIVHLANQAGVPCLTRPYEMNDFLKSLR